MEGCAVRKGLRFKHTVAKCANCEGPNSGQTKVCPRRKAARSEAKGWRSTLPRWRQRGEAPGVTEPRATAEGGQVDGGAEEQIRHESSSGEEMQEYTGGGSGCRFWEKIVSFPFTFWARGRFLCLCLRGGWGPYYDRQGRYGVMEKGIVKQLLPAASAAAEPLPWPFGLHVAGNKYKITHTA